ncbi:MAG: hypothetical protein JWO25_1799, partial [Alphaproteobacteria bacterium]|nr:hypothetical protein [Alphaproteobacteria bacterium]
MAHERTPDSAALMGLEDVDRAELAVIALALEAFVALAAAGSET